MSGSQPASCRGCVCVQQSVIPSLFRDPLSPFIGDNWHASLVGRSGHKAPLGFVLPHKRKGVLKLDWLAVMKGIQGQAICFVAALKREFLKTCFAAQYGYL